MKVDYIGCNPLDAVGAVPHGMFRLTFLPSVPILPDSWFAANWYQVMVEQLARIGATPYLYAAQGEPTVVDDETHGKAGVIDCMFRTSQASAPIQVAAQAVEDSYAYAKLARIERIPQITQVVIDARPEEQAQGAEAAATTETANSIGATMKRYAGWALFAVVVGVVGLIVWKAPKLSS